MYGSALTSVPVDMDLSRAASRDAGVEMECVYPFGDFALLMEELLKLLYRPSCGLVSAGHVTAEIALAASRADIELIEALGDSPFTGGVAPALRAVRSAADIFYLSSPNLVTGATYSWADMQRLCSAAPEGTVIVDERLSGCDAITAVSLLNSVTNLVVFSSFKALRGVSTSSAGFVVADPDVVSMMTESFGPNSISRVAREKIMLQGHSDDNWSARRKHLSDESLRIATELTRLGIQCRTTPTDFLLIRVANVKDTGNFLTANRVAVENLDGYPQMRHYLRYRLGSPNANDGLVEAFRRMPHECYRGTALDKRAVKRCRKAEGNFSG